MRITADTNVLVRAAVIDDAEQARLAVELLREAEAIAVTLPTLCEFVWVLRKGYKRTSEEIGEGIRSLLNVSKVLIDRPAVEAGLALLDAGGDFADGVIAFEGRRLGGDVFASFDRDAVTLIAKTGGDTRFLGGA